MMNKTFRGMFRFIVALTSFSALGALAQTTTAVAPQITQAIDPTVRHTLAQSVPARLQAAVDQGRASTSLPMKDILLRLKPSEARTKALTQFMADVQNPQSASYHKWVTPAEFGAKFGVSDADVQTVTNWLTTNGFTISEVAHSKGWIRFSGSSAQVERAFATEIHGYTLAGTKQYSNATALSIPSALAPAVEGLVSLNSFTKAPQHTKLAQLNRGANGKMLRTDAKTTAAEIAAAAGAGTKAGLLVNPNFTSQGAPEETFLAPGDFAKIYNTTPLIAAGTDGTGVSIAIVGRSDISMSDIESFRTVFNLPYNDPTFIHANDDPGVVVGDDEEAVLDVEWSGAVAPKAKINYVIGGSTYSTDGVDISASYIVDNVVAPIMSVSFGDSTTRVGFLSRSLAAGFGRRHLGTDLFRRCGS
jgi:subtilase family serine protease